jgi:hypothetical protein
MNIQSLTNVKIADANGMPTPAFLNFMSQFFQQMQQNFSQEGYKLPQQTTANISTLNTAKSTSAMVYDKDTHEFKVCINGTFKTVQVA